MRPKRKPTDTATPEKPSTPEFLTFGKPDIGPAEIEAVTAVLKSGWLSTGPVVKQFEAEFEKFIGSGYAVAVSSCTDALRLAMIVSCVGKAKREVITSPLTFAATVNAIVANDATPVFVDVTAAGQIDPDLIERAITPQTRAIMPVHYAGASADMRMICKLAEKYGLRVIEDAAHGFDGWHVDPMENNQPGYRRRIGTVGDFACFSFYPTKNITCGEGGMVMCKSRDLAERLRVVSMQGLSADAWKRYGSGPIQFYEVACPGLKANMSDIHAAIGLAQLRRWPELKAKRDAVWNVYEDAFGLKEPGHSKHLFTIRHPRRDHLRQFLYEKGIGTGIHFRALHLEPGYSYMGYKPGQFPKAERIGLETLSLPVSPTMTADDARRVVAAVKEFDHVA